MLSTPPKPVSPGAPFTPAQHLEALLDHTSDLNKANVLQATIPQWLTTAELTVVQAFKATLEQVHSCHVKARQALSKLKSLDEFCKEELTTQLKTQWGIAFDVERDTLDIITRTFRTTDPFLHRAEEAITTASRSLLQAAMENFTENEAATGGFPELSVIRINAYSQSGTPRTPAHFAALCRQLDLGARYQRHIDQVMALPPAPAEGIPGNAVASAADIRRLKVLELHTAAHIAYMKKDISRAVYTMMLSLIKQDVPAAQVRGVLFDGAPVIWQGLMIDDASVCGALVFTNVSIDARPNAKCVVYMPNEPRRPLYEYNSLDDFRSWLTLKLQSTTYRPIFARQYLPGHDKIDFFSGFDKDRKLGTLTAIPATGFSDFFFSAFISKTHKDALILAVPAKDVDEEQRQKTLKSLEDAGLLLLNAASFFVPVLGELMAVAAIVDIASEVYEGVQDWTHGERNEALSHVLSVVENLAQMAAFAVGGKVVTTAFKQGMQAHAAFFDGFEAVKNSDGTSRLWKPDLAPYQQAVPTKPMLGPDVNGIYKDGENSSIIIEGKIYRITNDPVTKTWSVRHPERQKAFQPIVERSVEGGWRHAQEYVHEWSSSHALKRMNPGLARFNQNELICIGAITELSPYRLHQLHETGLPLPARVKDCVERFRINQDISRLIARTKRGETSGSRHLQEQLHTLPMLAGWPKQRFIEVLDADDNVVSRFPATAPENDEINSVEVTRKQMSEGKLLDSVIEGLYPKEVEAMIGGSTRESKSLLLARKIGEHLTLDRQPLLDRLYADYDGLPSGDVATLRSYAPDLPTGMCRELIANASGRDRSFLRDRKIPGLDLAAKVIETRHVIRQDRALTGFFIPQLATADTDTLALKLMDRTQGWDDGYRLEVRKDSGTGALLASVGKSAATSTGIIVRTSTGYQVSQGNGTSVRIKTSTRLLDSIYHALPEPQRIRMGLSGPETADISRLRTRLLMAGAGDSQRTARILKGQRIDAPEHLSGCVQADQPATTGYAKSLIRSVRKLYPLFTDAQVSSFLDNAGSTQTLRVNRIRELELQLKKLREVLLAWRSDDVQMRALPGPLGDNRFSRRQMADAIENCWRRVTPPRWPENQPYTRLALERTPVGKLPTLTEQDVAHVRTLVIKDMATGDDLAYFLRPFKGLVTLELERNELTRLPEALSHMPNLEHLRLDGNKLVLTPHTLKKLSEMKGLRTLGLSGNRLGATIDVSNMVHLQALFLSDTHATALPVGLTRLMNLEFADLRRNEIRALPGELFQRSQRYARAIHLRDNPLSAPSLAQLTSYRDRTGVGMGVLDNRAMIFNEQLARDYWMPDPAHQTYSSRNNTWIALKNEPDTSKFFNLLAELGTTQDMRVAREGLTHRVWGVIDAAQADSALRERLLPMTVRANCTDSSAMIFSHLEMTVEIDRIERLAANAHDQAAQLLHLGRRLFRQDRLSKIIEEHISEHPGADAVEVELAYRTGLKDKLDLVGQPEGMRFQPSSGVTKAHLDSALDRIVTAELTPQLLEDLGQRSFWLDYLRSQHAQQFSKASEPFQARMDSAYDQQATLGAGYVAHCDAILVEQEQAQARLVEKLTTDALKADELKTCFMLD
jgi:Leucine-rich repeat (LRR) protein